MQNVIDAPRPATGADAETTHTDRNNQLSQFILTKAADLKAVAYETYPDLLVFDADKTICTLATRLSRYTGPVAEAPFMKWAMRFVIREAQRYKITATILREQKRVIQAAIREYRWTWCADYAVTNRDIFVEVAALIFQRAHSLNRKGKAKLSTRLTALVKKHLDFYHNHKNARRYKLVQKRVAAELPFACEQFSDEELAGMRSESESSYDPGYSECGLLEM